MILRESRGNYRTNVSANIALMASKFIKTTQSKMVNIENLGGQSFLLFPKKYFSSEQPIEKFVQVIEGKKLQKECDGVATKSATVTDDEMKKINGFALKELKKEDVVVYTLKVANNKVDRDMERFADDVLDSFAKSIVGKSWLYMHNKREFMPFGKLFDASTTIENGVKWLNAKGYVLAGDTELVQKIDSGIWKFVSIGFMAPEFMAVQDNSGKTLYYEYRNVQGKEAEGLEVSLVWLGAQYDAQVSKSADNALTLMKEAAQLLPAEVFSKCNTLDEVQQAVEQVKCKKALQQKYSQPKKGVRMKYIMKMFGKDKTVETSVALSDETSEAFAQEVAKQVEAEGKLQIDALQKQVDDLKSDAEKNKSAIEAHKDGLVNEVASLIKEVIGFADEGKRGTEVTRLKGMDVAALQAEKEIWVSRKQEKKPDGNSQTEAGAKGQKPEVAEISSVQQFA
jgi:hypothetical protein